MAEPTRPDPSLLVVAVFSRHADVFPWTQMRLQEMFGPIGMCSPLFPFHHTDYYESEMGTDLCKQFFAFAELASPDSLASTKLQTNELEKELAERGEFPEPRPVNVDPGLLQLGKFLLATTKDQAHRIYLRDGIFAEVTLRFQDKDFHPWPWTYADYREPALHQTLREFRKYYKRRMREMHVPKRPY